MVQQEGSKMDVSDTDSSSGPSGQLPGDSQTGCVCLRLFVALLLFLLGLILQFVLSYDHTLAIDLKSMPRT